MDFHKPKAAHNPREFAIELVTIVIGVLIALAAEAGVEHVRISRAVDYSRSDFINEIARNRADVNKHLGDARRLQATLESLLQEGMRYAQGKAGGLDYLAWKIGRHTGLRPVIRPWQQRWSLLGALVHLPGLLARGAVR